MIPMEETIEAGLGVTVTGAIMTALSTVAGSATTGTLVGAGAGLATGGTILIPIGIVLTGLGVYNSMKSKSAAAAVASAAPAS